MSDIRFCSAADRPRHPIYCILQYCSIGAYIAHQKWYQFQTQCIQENTDFSAPFHVLSINQSIVVSIVILCIWGAFRPAETVVTAACGGKTTTSLRRVSPTVLRSRNFAKWTSCQTASISYWATRLYYMIWWYSMAKLRVIPQLLSNEDFCWKLAYLVSRA